MQNLNVAVVAEENETAKNVFDTFANRLRFRRHTNLDRLQFDLIHKGKKIVPEEFQTLFQKLQEMGIGSIVNGRGNNPTRFVWNYNLKAVAKSAEQKEPLTNDSLLQKSSHKTTKVVKKKRQYKRHAGSNRPGRPSKKDTSSSSLLNIQIPVTMSRSEVEDLIKTFMSKK